MAYLEGGEEVHILSKFDGGYVVTYIYDDDDCPRCGDPFIVKSVYEDAPKPRLDVDIAKAEASLKTLREQLSTTQSEVFAAQQRVSGLQREYAKLNDSEQIPAGLLAAKRMLEGKINYYVVDAYYGAGIYAPKDVPRDWACGINVLILRVTDNGELEWLRQYSSDRKERVYPCLTREDAQEKCLELLVSNWKRNRHQVETIVEHANAAGVVLPQHILDAFTKKKDQDAADKRAAMEKAKAEAEKALAALA